MQESELIQLMRRDPPRGMELLVAQYTPLVCGVVRARLPQASPEDVEDCAGEAFARVYGAVERLDAEKGSLRGYLCAAARSAAVDLLRRQARQIVCKSLEDGDVSVCTPTPEEQVLAQERRESLYAALQALGEPDREIVVRRYILGESSRSVAQRLQMTVSAVDTRAHRALGKLRKSMGGLQDA